jgi:hypothetical protein
LDSGDEQMVFDGFAEIAGDISLSGIFKGDLSSLLSIFYLIISVAIYSIIIWHFYRFIAKRDIFKISFKSYPRFIGVLKYLFLYPFAAFLFFLGFSIMLLFLTKNLEIIEILSTSFALIAAIRISAYYSDDLSKDVAKMLPFALLGIFLIDPSFFLIEDVTNKILLLPEFFTVCIQFIIFIVVVEWILRFLLTVSIIARNIYKKDTRSTQQSVNT